MMHIWTVLSDKSLVNPDTNQVSLIDCLEVINLPRKLLEQIKEEKVNIPIKIEILSFWVDEENNIDKDRKIDMRIDFIDPKDNEISSLSHSFNLPKGYKRIRTRIKILGISINGEGDYLFRVNYKKEKDNNYLVVSEIPLTIKIDDSKTNTDD